MANMFPWFMCCFTCVCLVISITECTINLTHRRSNSKLPPAVANTSLEIEESVIVGLETEDLIIGLSRGSGESLLTNHGINVKHSMEIQQNTVVLVEKPNPSILKQLQADPRVLYIEPNVKVTIPRPVQKQRPSVHTDEEETLQCDPNCGMDMSNWGIIRSSYNSLPDYSTDPYLYDNLADDATIYILDTGVDIDHPEFGGRAMYGMVSDELADEGPYDGHGHGTNVASLAAGTTYGAAKNATIVSCKVLSNDGSGSMDGLNQAITWVTNQVATQQEQGKKVRAVISMSLEAVIRSGEPQSQASAINDAVSHSIVVVAAAGNDYRDASDSYPAAFDTTIAVGAIGPNDTFASFSNYGPIVDISAAGVDCLGAGSSYAPFCQGIPAGTCLVCYSGTSQATPHVSGVIAQWLHSLPDESLATVTPGSVRNMLQTTASLGFIYFPPLLNKGTTTFNGILFRQGDNAVNKVEIDCSITTTTTTSPSKPEAWVYVVGVIVALGLSVIVICILHCICSNDCCHNSVGTV